MWITHSYTYPSFQEKCQNVESHQLRWELLKMETRSTTIAYSKKFNLRNRESTIQRKLEQPQSWTKFLGTLV